MTQSNCERDLKKSRMSLDVQTYLAGDNSAMVNEDSPKKIQVTAKVTQGHQVDIMELDKNYQTKKEIC